MADGRAMAAACRAGGDGLAHMVFSAKQGWHNYTSCSTKALQFPVFDGEEDMDALFHQSSPCHLDHSILRVVFVEFFGTFDLI